MQGAVDEGVGGLFLAGVGVDGVQDGEAVPGAAGYFLGREIRVVRDYPYPPAAVWRALTDPA